MFKKRLPKAGARPGTLVIPEGALPTRIHLARIEDGAVEERDIADWTELREESDKGRLVWIDVQGLGNEEAIRGIGDLFSIHLLAMEDIVNVPQRPKAEFYEDQWVLTTRMVRFDDESKLLIEQVSVVFGEGYVLTFQERYGDVFDPIRRRIRNPKGRMRQYGASYLAYALFDTIIDGYYPILERIGDRLEMLEEIVFSHPAQSVLRYLNRVKKRLSELRRCISPQREMVNTLLRDASRTIEPDVQLYLRDTYDHCVHALEIADTCRETVGGLMNTYLSAVSNRTNDVMKLLTLVATIFIPLTFIAGIYGMNFDHMPELHVWWAYPAVWLLMLATAGGMVLYFRHKKWIGQGTLDEEGLAELLNDD